MCTLYRSSFCCQPFITFGTIVPFLNILVKFVSQLIGIPESPLGRGGESVYQKSSFNYLKKSKADLYEI